MSALNTISDDSVLRGRRLARDQTRALLGRVMGLVAFTLGCLALGAYVGRDLSGGLGIAVFVAGFACLIGLNIASARARQQLSIALPRRWPPPSPRPPSRAGCRPIA